MCSILGVCLLGKTASLISKNSCNDAKDFVMPDFSMML